MFSSCALKVCINAVVLLSCGGIGACHLNKNSSSSSFSNTVFYDKDALLKASLEESNPTTEQSKPEDTLSNNDDKLPDAKNGNKTLSSVSDDNVTSKEIPQVEKLMSESSIELPKEIEQLVAIALPSVSVKKNNEKPKTSRTHWIQKPGLSRMQKSGFRF